MRMVHLQKAYNDLRRGVDMGEFTAGVGPNMTVVAGLVLLFTLYFAKQIVGWVRSLRQ